MLRTSALGFGHLALASLLANDAAANLAAQVTLEGSLEPRPLLFTPRARRVIFLFMLGGPSHLGTFDPKPRLDREHGKPLPFPKRKIKFDGTGNLLRSPRKFRRYGKRGAEVSDLFPHVARHVDDLCIIRSMHGTNVAHGARSSSYTPAATLCASQLRIMDPVRIGYGESKHPRLHHGLSDARLRWREELE